MRSPRWWRVVMPGCVGECSTVRCSGWNFDHDVVLAVLAASTCIFLGVVERGGCGWWMSDTLLGPEGSGASLFLMANGSLPPFSSVGWVLVVGPVWYADCLVAPLWGGWVSVCNQCRVLPVC